MAGPGGDGYDVIVVGAGLGGVSSAALLAHHGKKVLVLEQGEGAGGFAHSFKRGECTFDSAVRIIAEGEFIEGCLDYLGVGDECTLLPMDHLYRVNFPDLSLFAPAGLEELIEPHVRAFPGEEEGIRAFFGLRRKIFLEAAQLPMQLAPSELEAAVERFPTLFKYRMATLEQVLDDHLHDPRLKSLCCALWPYMGTTPSRLSYFAYSQFLGVLVDGPFYVQGSFQNLVDAFVTALERNGGELRVNTAVEKIIVRDGTAVGVLLEDGTEIGAPTVISNADAHHTLDDLVGAEHLPAAYVKRLNRLTPSMSACVVYGTTREDLLAGDPAHETFIYKHWDHEDTWRDILAGKPGGMSISLMTMLDPGLAPPGEHVVIMTAVAAYDIGRPWEEAKEEYTDSLIAEFETVFPDLRTKLDWFTSGTPETLERYTRNWRGATYGWELTPRQIGSKRLGHDTPVTGLYLVGHWTEEGPASFRAVLSGRNTANHVLADDGEPDAIPTFKPDDIPGVAL